MKAAYGLYYKTRPAASKTSVARAKQLVDECGGAVNLAARLHPYFGGTSSSATEALVSSMRSFKPKVEDADRVLKLDVVKGMAQTQNQRELVKKLTEEALRANAKEEAEEDDE